MTVVLSPADIEALERAAVAAVAPPEVLELDGWLVPFDSGTIGRAKSAAPLSHAPRFDALDAVEAAYLARGLPPAFRIAEVPPLAEVRAELARRGYTARQPTLIMVGRAAGLSALSAGTAEVLDKPDAAWAAVFLGEGFDPADGAHRVAALSRSPGAVFAAASENGRTLAVGAASFGHGWAGIHGMRTAAAHRGKGLASRVLGALGRAIADRGFGRVFLQVEEANPARSLYRRAGFGAAWAYRYWRRS